MEIEISRVALAEPKDDSKESLESACIANIADCIQFFKNNNIRVGKDAVYMVIGEKVFKFIVNIKFISEVSFEQCGVTFYRNENES